jgi:O-antigen ligase
MIRERVGQTIVQLENQFGPERKHSPDPRMEFFANTAKLIRRHPFMGTGTGSFRAEYARQVAGTDDKPTSDPHNEYLHLATQLGIPGAAFFVVLLGVQWFAASRLQPPERHVGRGVVLTIAVGSLFNSLILSITGGLIYSYFTAIAFAELSQSARQASQISPSTSESEAVVDQQSVRKAA